ncbi:MAG: HD-GYP domain-containing protein, partial [Synergistota bacterium]|nr:HD-GYP domain-containing protein [Synergistota bacterium]
RTTAYNAAASVTRRESERGIKSGYEKLEDTFTDVIRTMGQIVGKKDPYTIEHQERVADLALELGRRLGLDEDRCEGLHIAGLVHDIGKIEIPSEILSKPGKLSKMEFELIKTHAESGYDILSEVDFPWPVADIARQHHERLDGSGYPGGLKGNEVLLEARIVAVADVVESMMSHRPYRPSLGMEAALEEICSKRGVLYDPDVVDACLELFAERPDFLEEGDRWPA